jgi:hypothetical protein
VPIELKVWKARFDPSDHDTEIMPLGAAFEEREQLDRDASLKLVGRYGSLDRGTRLCPILCAAPHDGVNWVELDDQTVGTHPKASRNLARC